MSLLLRMASVVLPPAYRDRWQEEAAAVLMDVSGARRVWFTVDTVVKVPLLAFRLQRPVRVGVPTLVGATLLASVLAMLSGVVQVLPGAGTPDPVAYLMVMGGLCAVIAARSFGTGRRLRYADSGAVLVIVGPLATGHPVVVLVGAVLPGVWLAVVSAGALRRRVGPRGLAVVGVVAGVSLVGALGNLALWRLMPDQETLARLIGHGSLIVGAPAYLLWSAWAGVRLLFGRRELLGGTS